MMKRRWLNILALSLTMVVCCAFGGCNKKTNDYFNDVKTAIQGSLNFSKIQGGNAYRVLSVDEDMRDTVTEIVIPDTYLGLPVVEIGDSVFSSCYSLTSVVIPDSVTSIGDSAFWGCGSLTSVVIPDSVTRIGEYAFYGCSSLTEMTLPFVGASKSATGHESVFGYIFGYTTKYTSSSVSGATYQYSSGGTYYHYDIPASLKKVTITNGPIGDRAFYNCNRLTSVVIGDGITTIGEYAFDRCSSLTSVVIGDKVTTIGEYAFFWCDSLTSVYYKGTASEWGNISIEYYYNYDLAFAARYYYDESESVASWWHYDGNGNVVHA